MADEEPHISSISNANLGGLGGGLNRPKAELESTSFHPGRATKRRAALDELIRLYGNTTAQETLSRTREQNEGIGPDDLYSAAANFLGSRDSEGASAKIVSLRAAPQQLDPAR